MSFLNTEMLTDFHGFPSFPAPNAVLCINVTEKPVKQTNKYISL